MFIYTGIGSIMSTIDLKNRLPNILSLCLHLIIYWLIPIQVNAMEFWWILLFTSISIILSNLKLIIPMNFSTLCECDTIRAVICNLCLRLCRSLYFHHKMQWQPWWNQKWVVVFWWLFHINSFNLRLDSRRHNIQVSNFTQLSGCCRWYVPLYVRSFAQPK